MHKIKRLIFSLTFIFVIIGCTNPGSVNEPLFFFITDDSIIEVGEEFNIEVNDEFLLEHQITDISFFTDDDCIIVSEDGVVTALHPGNVTITGNYQNSTDEINITVIETTKVEIEIKLEANNYDVYAGDSVTLLTEVTPLTYSDQVEYIITSGRECARINENTIQTLQSGQIKVIAKVNDSVSNEIVINIQNKDITSDPYENVNIQEFYNNYVPAISYMDSYYRTIHGLMSGSIEPQDPVPDVAKYQPKQDGKLIRNSSSIYSSDGNTYYILDCFGEVTNQIYKGGAYTSLEEVAAYVLAFNDIPANYTVSKKTKPTSSIWGKYLRVNHNKFSGDTSRYPYEPKLPNISGCGGEFTYYELDLGTTGTDTGGGYEVAIYNDGTSITRGAARIVYSRFDRNGDNIIDINEKFVFYTYNHYNDFQEYLNYEGGWGEIFGNITGGGKLSSKTDYNPTPYIEVVLKNLNELQTIDLIMDIHQTLNNLSIVYIMKEYDIYY